MSTQNMQFNGPEAVVIGLRESIVLHHLHWLLHNDGETHDGRTYVRKTYPEWFEAFPFWSEGIVKKTIRSLEAKSIIITGRFNELAVDRTKWYAVNPSGLDAYMKESRA